jgi:hypothetical protein
VNRRCGTGQIVDLLDIDEERLRHIVPDELELGVIEYVGDVLAPTGEQVVEADHMVTFCEQSLTEVGTNESGAAGHEDAHVPGLVVGTGREP